MECIETPEIEAKYENLILIESKRKTRLNLTKNNVTGLLGTTQLADARN